MLLDYKDLGLGWKEAKVMVQIRECSCVRSCNLSPSLLGLSQSALPLLYQAALGYINWKFEMSFRWGLLQRG